MGESELHRFLKYVGLAFLHNQRCVLTGTEVVLRKPAGYEFDRDKNDNKHVIDIVGWGEKPIFEAKYYSNTFPYKSKVGSINILRGIEVKVSLPDFKNGFCSSGCNFHYILTPMKLINPKDLPDWVGLIEFNKYKFTCGYSSQTERFSWDGVKIVKKAKFLEVDERITNSNMWNLAKRANRLLMKHVLKEIKENLSNHVYDYIASKEVEI